MIPMRGQYEQQCNALAASRLGVPVIYEIGDSFVNEINKWLNDDKRVMVDFPNETAGIVDRMVKQYRKNR